MQITIHNPNKLPTIDYRKPKPLQHNLKDLSEANAERLKNVLERRGFTQPMNLWKKGDDYFILDAHQRQRVMKAFDMNDNGNYEVPYFLTESKDEAEAKMQILEISSQYGTITQEGFDEFAVELPEAELPDIYFDALFHDKSEPEVEEDEPPEVAEGESESKLGEIYQLGRHRLMCGDSTDFGKVSDLMNGDQFRVVVTSPPYANLRDYNIGDFDWDKLMNGVVDTFAVSDNFDALINLGQVHKDKKVWFYWDGWLKYCEQEGYPLFGLYIWDKQTPIPGDYAGRLALRHEFIFHFRNARGSANKTVKSKGTPGTGANTFRQKDGTLKKANGNKETLSQPYKLQDSIIQIVSEKNNRTNHPAVYPPRFAAELIKPWSKEGDVVYDPFGGSGSTLIACEQLNRICYMAELDPKYVDVIRKRYWKFINDGGEDGWQTGTPKIT